MDMIKEAFSKIKEDIQSLKNEILQLKLQISQQTDKQTYNQTNPTDIPTQISQQTDKQTYNQTNPTDILPVEHLYNQNSNSSTGNKGVPTNQQTNKLTNRQTYNIIQNTTNSEFKQANDILASLDNLKKGIRLKFKRLTTQEMLVFSTLYALEEQNNIEITYRTLAGQIGLSESSMRDYTNKLIKKGIPIEKIRKNNKTIVLKISQTLKNIATLATIQTLREI